MGIHREGMCVCVSFRVEYMKWNIVWIRSDISISIS